MTSITITDDCLAPEKFVWLHYSGPDPWAVAKKITDSIRMYFHASASSTNQQRLNWDISGDPIGFYSLWWVKKSYSYQTRADFYIMVQGSKSKVDNTGEFSMRMNATVTTKLSGPSIFLKPFWMVYSYLYYDKFRRRIVENCRDLTLNFRNVVKEHYGMGVTPVPATHAVFD